MVNFGWKDIYMEISVKLLDFEDKQGELLDLMEKFDNQSGRDTIPNLINAARKVRNEDQKIDPFTFLACPGRLGDVGLEFLRFLKKTWELENEVSDGWDALLSPRTKGGLWWYFDEKQRVNIPKLWTLFKNIVTNKSLAEADTDFIKDAKEVGWATMTKGLYWARPDKYICINGKISHYLKNYDIKVKVSSYNDYMNIIHSIKNNNALKNKNFMEITYEAVRSKKGKENNVKKNELNEVINNKKGKENKVKKNELNEATKEASIVSDMNKCKNRILFGPPGTGKTFKMQKDYMKHFRKERKKTRIEFYKDIIKENSLTWYECIALAMLDLTSTKSPTVRVPKIVKHEMIKAKSNKESVEENNIVWQQLREHTPSDCEGVNYDRQREPYIFWKDKPYDWRVDRDMIKAELPKIITILETMKDYGEANDESIENFEFVTFHQSFSYEDFIEGIKPSLNEEGENLAYKIEKGVFLRLAERARNDSNNRYALFIDEINRGNISNIFGELITLIEEDKREGCDNEVKVILPYSKEEFTVPKNLHIIATMNTADRSIESLDSALRRRFEFIEVAPDATKIEVAINEGTIDLEKLLIAINKRLFVLIGKDKLIGHSYFMNISDIEDLRKVFKNKIIPLLEEYFYNDRQKILMVLGPKFVKKKEWRKKDLKLFDSNDDLEDVITYEFTKSTDWEKEDAFRSIYKETDETGTNDNTNNKQNNNVDGKK